MAAGGGAKRRTAPCSGAPAACAATARSRRRGRRAKRTRCPAQRQSPAPKRRRAARSAGQRRQSAGELALRRGAVHEPGAARRESREQVVGVPAQRLARSRDGARRAPAGPRGAAHVGVPAALEHDGAERADRRPSCAAARRSGRRTDAGRRRSKAPPQPRGGTPSGGLPPRGGTGLPRSRREPRDIPPRRGWQRGAVVRAAPADLETPRPSRRTRGRARRCAGRR